VKIQIYNSTLWLLSL